MSPLRIAKHDTDVRITCKAENKGMTTSSTWSQGSFWAKPTHKGLLCALQSSGLASLPLTNDSGMPGAHVDSDVP